MGVTSEKKLEPSMDLELVEEGFTSFYRPVARSSIPRASDAVFFNPRQEINRTISVLALNALLDLRKKSKESIKVCEPLSATGIRGLRYLNEVEPIMEVCLNDLNPRAVFLMKKNAQLLLEERVRKNLSRKVVTIDHRDAARHLHAHHLEREYFDIVDIDPYGTPAPFLESAMFVLGDEGILAATATDLPSLVGNYPAVAFENLGISSSFKFWFHHEFALRTFILGMMWPGFKHGKFFKPMLAFYKDHYVRAFIQRVRGKEATRKNVGFLGVCSRCFIVEEYRPYWKNGTPPLARSCSSCDDALRVVGPCWLGPLQDPRVLEWILKSEKLSDYPKSDKISRFLRVLEQENAIDLPFHYDIHVLCRTWKLSALSTRRVIEALRDQGYDAVRVHYRGTAFKTDAPPNELQSLLHSLP